MKPRIRRDLWGSGWVCKLRGTRNATGGTPKAAYLNWAMLNGLCREVR